MIDESYPEALLPVKSTEFLPEISIWETFGGLLLVGTVGVLIVLAAVIKYPITVKAPSVVRPAGDLRVVQTAIAGTIETIMVKENQQVRKGDAIATLNSSRLQAEKTQLQGNIRQNQQQLTQINLQMQALQTQINAEANSTQRVLASAEADLSRNQRDYQDKQIISSSEVQEAEATLELTREELRRYQQLGNTGAIAILQIKEKEQAFKAATARLISAKALLNPSSATVAIASEKIAEEQAKGESTLAILSQQKQELKRRQVEIQTQISRNQIELKQLEKDLQKNIIRASESGVILKLALKNPDQVVSAGDAIAEIAPNKAPLVVKARVAAEDISKVKLCKAAKIDDCTAGKVEMRVSTYPYPDYGTLQGRISAIAPDTTKSQNNTSTPYYEVTIQPETTYLVKNGQKYFIQPGMEIRADIISTEETILKFILRSSRLISNL
jgi:HlyD family type I secretion membrane fusion protein